jgi:hypothetical protein
MSYLLKACSWEGTADQNAKNAKERKDAKKILKNLAPFAFLCAFA